MIVFKWIIIARWNETWLLRIIRHVRDPQSTNHCSIFVDNVWLTATWKLFFVTDSYHWTLLIWRVPMANERLLLCRYWLAPIGKSLGIKSTKAKPPVPNKSLEDAYTKSAKLNHKTVSFLSSIWYSFYFVVSVTKKAEQCRSLIGASSVRLFCAIFLRLAFAIRHWHSS